MGRGLANRYESEKQIKSNAKRDKQTEKERQKKKERSQRLRVKSPRQTATFSV